MKPNLNYMKKFISTNDITFLAPFDRTIEINKTGRSMYFRMTRISLSEIDNFILNLDNFKIYMTNPFISVSCKYEDPIITLSRPFLITNESNPKLIYDHLFSQFEKANNDFNMDIESEYFLYFSYKAVDIDKRI